MRFSRTAEFPIWKTIKLGTGLKTKDDFCKAFEKGSIFYDQPAIQDMLGSESFRVATAETEIDLVIITGLELGLVGKASLSQILKAGRRIGLQPCPPEVGPQGRLQYLDQPKSETVFVAMAPIKYSVPVIPLERSAIFVLYCAPTFTTERFLVDLRTVAHAFRGGTNDNTPGPFLWLYSESADYLFEPNSTWVFCRPRR